MIMYMYMCTIHGSILIATHCTNHSYEKNYVCIHVHNANSVKFVNVTSLMLTVGNACHAFQHANLNSWEWAWGRGYKTALNANSCTIIDLRSAKGPYEDIDCKYR